MTTKIKILLLLVSVFLLYPIIADAQFTHTDVLSCVPNGPAPTNATACPNQSWVRNYSCDQSTTVLIGGITQCPGLDWSVPFRTLVSSCNPIAFGEYLCNICFSISGGVCAPISGDAGVCGPFNGQSFSSTPTGIASDFCAVGIFSGLSGSGPWTWSCQGVCAVSASCSAQIKRGWKEIAP